MNSKEKRRPVGTAGASNGVSSIAHGRPPTESLLLYGVLHRPAWYTAHAHLIDPILFGHPARRAIYYAATGDPRMYDMVPHIRASEIHHEMYEIGAMRVFVDARITQALRDLRHAQDRADIVHDVRAALAPGAPIGEIVGALREIAQRYEDRIVRDEMMEAAA